MTSNEPRIIYVAGYGRSGSTLMDMLLDCHTGVIGVGEVRRLFEHWLDERVCSCGRSVRECTFWAEVMDEFQARMPGTTIEEAQRITLAIEGFRSLWYRFPARYAGMMRRYRAIWTTLLVAVRRVSGVPVVVDSSKSAYRAALRPLALARICGLDVRVVHLVRDPRGAMWSVAKGLNERLEAGTEPSARGGGFRALAGWSVANLAADANRRASRTPSLLVRYEDLVDDPARVISDIADTCGLDPDPILTWLRSEMPAPGGHGVAGNRLRRSGSVTIRSDLEWQEKLSLTSRLASTSVWPIGRRYGYRWYVPLAPAKASSGEAV